MSTQRNTNTESSQLLFAMEDSAAFDAVRRVYAEHVDAHQLGQDPMELSEDTKIDLLRRKLQVVGGLGRTPNDDVAGSERAYDRIALERVLMETSGRASAREAGDPAETLVDLFKDLDKQ